MKKFRRPLTWGLILTFATLTVLGEFLHFLPGCSHYVRQPDGSLFLLGQRETGSQSSNIPCCPSPDQSQTINKNHGDGLPTLDMGECPICDFVGLQKQTSRQVAITFLSTQVDLLVAVREDAYRCLFTTQPSVRGPPLS
ncbi:MAG: hypothetical protein PVH19_02995 [Planctomycetia bacterium]|jgi:hypothetical protein